MIQIDCPLCGSSSIFLLESIDVPKLIISWRKEFRIDISEELKDVPKIELFLCNRCGLRFYTPPTVAGSSELYSQLQKIPWYYTSGKWEHDVALRDLAGCQAILEVGCGAGAFIARARSEKTLTVLGIEANREAVHKAQQLGLTVRDMELQEAAHMWAGHYDAVCAFQVLEHVPNPKQFLECSCTLLRPGGLLLLGLPNADSFLKYESKLLDMPPHHMTRWSDRVLSYLPELFPLRLIETRSEPLAEYHVGDYIKAYRRIYASRGIPKVLYPHWLQRGLRGMLKATRLRKLLRGQSLYAKLQRTSCEP